LIPDQPALCDLVSSLEVDRARAFASVSEDPVVGSDVIVARGASVLAGAEIGDGVRVQVGAVVGRNARVCAGAVVTPSVPANAIVSGNPAKISGYVGLAQGAAEAAPAAAVSGPRAGAPLQPSVVAGVSLHRASLHGDRRGSLVANEFGRDIPFEPRRTFLVFDVPKAEVRGEHAHRECHQFISCVHGACSSVADDGRVREEFRLDDPTIEVYIPPMVWCSQYGHLRNAVLLVHASDVYDPDDYIHDYGAYVT